MLPLIVLVRTISRNEKVPQMLIAFFLFIIVLPKPDACYVHMANAFRDLGLHARAEQIYQKAANYNSLCFDAWFNLTSVMAERGDFDGATRACDGAMQASAPDIESFCKIVVMRAGCGQWVPEQSVYEQGLKTDKRDAEGWFRIGTQLLRTGENKGAELAFRRVTELRPYSDIAWFSLGNAVFSPNEAIRDYIKALDLNPSFAEAWCGLGGALLGIDNWQAQQALENALTVSPTYARAWHLLGRAHRCQGNESAAQEAFSQAEKYGWKADM